MNASDLASFRSLACLLLLGAMTATGCGGSSPAARNPAPPAALVAESRPIGRGPRFQPPARGPVLGPCLARLGPRFGVHVEVFAANRVVVIPAAIGTRPPRSYSESRISKAHCYGALVTLEPTGVVVIRPGGRLTLKSLFRSWGEPLSPRRLASFSGHVRAFVDGREWKRLPGLAPLRRHSEIVLEVGPYVPPHARYAFPPGS